MALVSGFKGSYYKIHSPDLSSLIIPPYDAIPEGAEEKYRAKSNYNFAHVDLSRKENDDYSSSKTLLSDWVKKGIVEETSTPCYFLYQQSFSAYGKEHTRRTLLCTVGLEDFSKGIVRPHENTFGKYKADRLQLLRMTQYNLSHIFGMVKDSEGFLNSQFEKWVFEKPFLSATSEDGVSHTVWKTEVNRAPDISAFFKDKPIYIVDGHHRYESALMYAKEMGVEGKFEHPAAHTTFCIANVYDPGLVVYPTHRILRKGLLKSFSISQLEKDYAVTPLSFEQLKKFVSMADPTPRFALYYDGKLYSLLPRDWVGLGKKVGVSVAKLAVTWSDHCFLKDFCGVNDSNRGTSIRYEKDVDFTWSLREQSDLILFHAPPAVSDVTAVADEKKYMPQKSTFFIPKLAGGLVFRKFGRD